ncbi:MAG: amino acid adenylation domain-containing protein [Chlamydiota bacterium]
MDANNILEMIKHIVEGHENDDAVIFKGKRISYSELDERSDKLAQTIIAKGVKPGSIVALGLYNDIDLIPALLAIWKANCVYLPVDPGYPPKRIEMLLKIAQPDLLITKKEIQSKFSLFKSNTYVIDEEENVQNIKLRNPQLSDLAYIMFTSGSTGIPKGIVVDHLALQHSALAYNELHPEKFKALVAGSISFDPSLLTLVSTLAKGGTLCLYDNRDGIDISRPQQIVDLINSSSVSFILSTPSFYSKLIEQNKILPSLKNVDLCGEDIPRNLIDTHAKISPNATLYNVYGPTEYAMGVSAGILYDPKEEKISQVTIGKPFACNKIYILDRYLNRAKPGKKGEIYIGGPGLAKEYFKQKKLTKERFLIINHLESYPIRVFRTGDRGYFLPTGEIVFVGRTDLQVKINGHRVELEEVEKFIGKCPQIEKVVALVVQEENQNRIVAFFSGKEAISPNQVRDFLSHELPPYMIPTTIIQISDWPLTSNGKIDKKNLMNFLPTRA